MIPLLLLALAAPPAADDPLPQHAVARLGPTRFHLDYGISSLAISPDGTRVAIPGVEGIIAWDTTTSREAARYPTGYCLAYSPDGRTLATVGEGGQIYFFDTTTGRETL